MAWWQRVAEQSSSGGGGKAVEQVDVYVYVRVFVDRES